MSYVDCQFCNAVNYHDNNTCEKCGKHLSTGHNIGTNKKRILTLMIWVLFGVGGLFLLCYLFGTQGDLTMEEKWNQDKSWRNNMRRSIEEATYFH